MHNCKWKIVLQNNIRQLTCSKIGKHLALNPMNILYSWSEKAPCRDWMDKTVQYLILCFFSMWWKRNSSISKLHKVNFLILTYYLIFTLTCVAMTCYTTVIENWSNIVSAILDILLMKNIITLCAVMIIFEHMYEVLRAYMQFLAARSLWINPLSAKYSIPCAMSRDIAMRIFMDIPLSKSKILKYRTNTHSANMHS